MSKYSGKVIKCKNHKGFECENCGGLGWKRECHSRECVEYGCDGGLHCHLIQPGEKIYALGTHKETGFLK